VSAAYTQTAEFQLVSVAGPTSVSLALTPPGPITLGRAAHHTLELPDSRVSRDHAVLTYISAQWQISDTGSLHGTWVNGIRLESGQARLIRPGDSIVIGPWTLRVQGGERAADSELSIASLSD
jgi:pSer/pThr/pTyr-binding forkhead associated (FHA) protein